MCGIVGFAGGVVPDRERQASLRAMCAAIVHRGPNEEGRYLASEVALGMRRLSVMDPALGQQPMGNEDGTIQLVFNGEIYNHRQLRRELLARGHVLATSTGSGSSRCTTGRTTTGWPSPRSCGRCSPCRSSRRA